MPGILGIDPGVHGALALYNPLVTAPSGIRWVISDLPDNGAKLGYWVQRWSPHICCVELTYHNIGGTHASFVLGERTGWVLGVLEMCGMQIVRASPSAWKRKLGLIKADKNASLKLAREIVGGVPELDLKKHHNRAEAALMAYYTSLKYGDLI